MMKQMLLALLLSAGSVYGQLADYKFKEATTKDYEKFTYWTGAEAVEMVVCDTVGLVWTNCSSVIREEYQHVECLDYGRISMESNDEFYMVFVYTIADELAPYPIVLLTMNLDKSTSKAYMSK